jgi:hypothetical protein
MWRELKSLRLPGACMARLRMVEFKRFLIALSVRPGSRCKFKE